MQTERVVNGTFATARSGPPAPRWREWAVVFLALLLLAVLPAHAVTCTSGGQQWLGYDAAGGYASISDYCAAAVAAGPGRTGAVVNDKCVVNQTGYGEWLSWAEDVCMVDSTKLTAAKAVDLMALWQLLLACGVVVFCVRALYNKFRLDHD